MSHLRADCCAFNINNGQRFKTSSPKPNLRDPKRWSSLPTWMSLENECFGVGSEGETFLFPRISGALWRGLGSEVRGPEVCVCVWAHGGKPREPLRMLVGCRGVLSENPGLMEEAGLYTLKPHAWKTTQPFSGLRWSLTSLEPGTSWDLGLGPHLPCCWVTPHCWPWNHIPRGTGLVLEISSRNYYSFLYHSVLKTTHHFLFLIPHCPIA